MHIVTSDRMQGIENITDMKEGISSKNVRKVIEKSPLDLESARLFVF